MKTLKKVLAVVLALAMVLGMTITASAAFTDDAKITYKDAVNVLTGLGVINGKPNGGFDPQGNLTRAEACKILTYLLGFEDVKGTPSFKDAQQSWAANFIAFCESEGLVAGTGAGKFEPNGTLTGFAWAKMLLCAAGYNAEAEGFTGSNWAINVQKALNVAGQKLVKDIDGFNGMAAVTRDEACEMAFELITNTLTRKYTEGTKITGTNIAVNLGGSYTVGTTTLIQDVFGATAKRGIVVANSSNIAGQTYTTVDEDGAAGEFKVDVNTGADLYGKHVTVYYKTLYTSKNAKGTAYAVVDDTTALTVNKDWTAKEFKEELSAAKFSILNTLTFTNKYQNGASSEDAKTITVGTTSGAGCGAVTLYGYKATSDAATLTPYGYAVADKYSVGKVTAISTVAGKESISVDFNGSATKLQNNATTDEVVEYDGIAVDDVVLVYKFGGVYNLYKADVVTGKVTAAKSGSTPSITVNGTKYTYADAPEYCGTNLGRAEVNFTNEYTLYLTKDGKVATVVGVDAVADLVYVVETYTVTESDEYGAKTPKYFVQGVNTAGEEVSYRVYYNSGYMLDKDFSGAIVKNTLYKVTTAYDETAKADMATLASPAEAHKKDVVAANTELKTSSVKVSDEHYYASDVKFIFVEDSKADIKITVKEGPQAVAASAWTSLPGHKWSAYGTKAETATNFSVTYVFVSAAPAEASYADAAYAYETKNSKDTVPYTTAAGATSTAYKHTVYVDGEKTEILMTSKNAISGFKKLTKDETTGITTVTGYTSTDKAKAVTGATIASAYGNYLTVETVVTDANMANAKVVDLTDNGIDSVGELVALKNNGSGTIVKVSFIYDDTDSNDAVAIIYIVDASFTARLTNGAGTLTASTNSTNDFGTDNVNVAVDGYEYTWYRSPKAGAGDADADWTEIVDATTNTISRNASVYDYKVVMKVTTTDGYVYEAAAYQNN